MEYLPSVSGYNSAVEDEKHDSSVPVLNYQPPREREKPVVPLGLSALILVLSFIAMALGGFIGLIAWADYGVESRMTPEICALIATSMALISGGLLFRWLAVRASRFRK